MKIQDMDELFHEALGEVHSKEVVLIPEGVDVGEGTGLRRSSEKGIKGGGNKQRVGQFRDIGKQPLEEDGKGNRKRRGFYYDCNLQSGIKLIWYTLEMFADSVRLAYVARNGGQFLNCNNDEDGYGGVIPCTISW